MCCAYTMCLNHRNNILCVCVYVCNNRIDQIDRHCSSYVRCMWRAPSVLRLRRCGVVLVLFMDRSFATRDDVFSTFCCEMLLCRAGLLSLRDSRSHQHSVLAAKHVLTIAMLRILCGAVPFAGSSNRKVFGRSDFSAWSRILRWSTRFWSCQNRACATMMMAICRLRGFSLDG